MKKFALIVALLIAGCDNYTKRGEIVNVSEPKQVTAYYDTTVKLEDGSHIVVTTSEKYSKGMQVWVRKDWDNIGPYIGVNVEEDDD